MTPASPLPVLRVLIVDDEPLARRGLRAQIDAARLAGPPMADWSAAEVVGECATGRAAVDAIQRLAPDVVLLDVQMPDLDGLDVVKAVGADAMPVVVVVTAHDVHALRAFDAQALDYVLKPIDPARFARALTRAARRAAERRETGLGAAAVGAPGPTTDGYADRFLVTRGSRVVVIPADAVDWIAADGDYVRLHVGRERHLLRERVARLTARLDPRRFVRIHRSTIVNVDRVREWRPHTNRELHIVLRDGTRLKVSRSYREEFDARFRGPAPGTVTR